MTQVDLQAICTINWSVVMASILKREWIDKNGELQVRWDVYIGRKGTRRHSKSFKTKASAERWTRMAEAEMELGGFKSTDAAERMTLSEAMRRYAEEELPRLKSRKSVEYTLGTLNRFLGTYPLIAIDGPVLAQYQRKRLGMRAQSPRTQSDGSQTTVPLGRFIANNTVRREMALISCVFSCAIKQWGIHLPHGNPVRLVRLPPMGKGRDRRMTAHEEEKILTVLDPKNDEVGQRNTYMHAVVIFAVETTSRRGEIVKLKWRDVNLEARTAVLRDTKNGSDRAIGLSTRAVEALRSIPRTKDERVFPISENAVKMAWARVMRRTGITGLCFHDLRHEATSRLATKFKGDILALSAMTGHKSLQMLKRYTHIQAEELASRLG